MRFRAHVFLLAVAPVLLLGGATAAHALTRSESGVTTPVAARTPAPRPATFTFVGGGDIALTGDADASVFARIRPFLRHGDLIVGNLEGTLATGGVPKCTSGGASGCFTFRGSPGWAATLRHAGFT